ncbi:MAG: alkaline phosphatase family protein [Cyclobacteriaceae bacterium]
MKKLIVLLLFCLAAFGCNVKNDIERPRLVVGIVVDQMRQEYLFRFYDKFGNDGFKRLMNKGFMMRNAHYNYVPTYTGPGHTSIYTGTTPRVHGVIANDWYEKKSGGNMYCAGDSTVQAVGGSPKAGKISARNMLSTTITDELGQFYQNRSKIVGISIKDRGAALPAGHNPTGAFWYDGGTGEFMSSTYYMDKLPDWVVEFNNAKLYEKYMSGVWDTSFPIDEYVESDVDDREGEKLLGGKTSPTFPYDLKELSKDGGAASMIRSTPYGNSILKDLALATIEGESMGQDDITDFLAVSFSSTDYVGHAFGPYSKEVEDTYVKLDKDLAELFKYLDENVGLYEYSVFLTADHAVAEIPKYLQGKNYPVEYFEYGSTKQSLNTLLVETFERDDLISSVSNNQIFLNKKVIREYGLDERQVKKVILDYLKEVYGIASAYDSNFLSSYSGSNKDIMMLAAGYNAHRSGDILMTLNPGWLGEGNKNSGTTHGSHYTYDTHVPMLFYGKDISVGSSVEYHTIADLAPTISMILNIKLPSGATGQPIDELFIGKLQ